MPVSLQNLTIAGAHGIAKFKEEAQTSKTVTAKEGYEAGDSEDDEFDPDKTLSEEEDVRLRERSPSIVFLTSKKANVFREIAEI